MINNKLHICIIDNGVCCGLIRLFKNLRVVGKEIREVVSESDRWSHGTVCTRVIEKNIIKPYELSSITVLNSQGKGKVDDLLLALEWCKNNAVDIINLSMGSICYKDQMLLQNTINECVCSGIIIVAALSNEEYVTYPARFTNVIAVKKSEKLNVQEYEVNYNSGLGFGVVETYGNYTEIIDDEIRKTKASNSIATPYVTSKIAEIYFKGINPFYIRRFFAQEQMDINCFYVDWIRTAFFDQLELSHSLCSFYISNDIDSSDTIILSKKEKIDDYLEFGKNIIYLGNSKLETKSDNCYIWSKYNRMRQIELISCNSDNKDIDIPIIFVKGNESLYIVRKLCNKMIEQDYNAYGITGKIIGEVIGLRYIPMEKKKNHGLKNFICNEVACGQYDIIICDLGNNSKEDYEAEINIFPDVYIYIDDVKFYLYSEKESKEFVKDIDLVEQYITELLTVE